MRKKITGVTGPARAPARAPAMDWHDLQRIATVELTSEDPQFPIESAFADSDGPGWRASQAGEQKISLVFDHPVPVHRIQLCFHETQAERTQEFTLRSFSPDGVATEIVRQQWNFSPSGATTETEDYRVDLQAVAALELSIRPDLNRGPSVASLASWLVG